MILKYIKSINLFLLFIACANFLIRCKAPVSNKTFSYHKAGYWWKLISFQSDSFSYSPNSIAWISADFKTQNDSVFYDSEHDLRDRFFIKIDSNIRSNCLKHLVSVVSANDSVCGLINTKSFFKQQFNSEIPFFCKNDSVIKVNFKIKQILNEKEYGNIKSKIINNETKEIESYFGNPSVFENSRDSLGFYWVEKPIISDNSQGADYGDQITISYEGAFLNGRIMDSSPPEFQINYGTPDQLLKGINFVISRLKKGQNSKIILPSHLAFGETGSSNGSIPPFTPMLYKISIIEIKKPASK